MAGKDRAKRLPLYILSIMLLASLSSKAQKGNLKGFVLSEKSGEALPFTTVALLGTPYSSGTDINGFFNIPNIPTGDYTLITRFVGYNTDTQSIHIDATKTLNIKINLKEEAITMKEVNVSAQRTESKTQTQVSTITLTPKLINKIPTIGGEPELAQFLQIIPGIVFTGDQGGQIFIRGGGAINTLFLLDGMPIYNPFHSIGLYSVYETELIKNVDVLTGGFPAEFGNRTAAVIDVSTRDGNRKRISGKLSANPFMSKAILEGPLWKYKENRGSGSFIFSGKYSYIDKLSKCMYPYVQGGNIPYNFMDFYGKLSFNTKGGSKFNLFGFNFRDKAVFNKISETSWNAWGVGANFVLVPNKGKFNITTNFNYSNYALTQKEQDGRPRNSSIGGFNLSMAFKYFLRDGDLSYGIQVTGFKTIMEFYNQLGTLVDQNQNTTEIAAYLKLRKQWGKLVFEPGVRLQYYGSLSEFSAEPRLRMKYNVHDKFRLKLASGLFSQNLISTKSDRDVVNLFNGFLSGPEEQLNNTQGKPSKSKLQHSVHAILGAEYEPVKNFSINVEPYYIYNWELININRNKLFNSDPNYMIEKGSSYGVDFLFKYETKRIFAWLGYSLAWITRNDGKQTYNPHYDRRHNLNLAGSYTFGKRLNWEVDLRFALGSGFPFTRTAGFYEDLQLSNGVTTNVSSENGQLGIVYENKLNQGRLPIYHRLDLGLKKKWQLGKNSLLETNLSLSNVYNRQNLFYIDRVSQDKIYQLPILPSFGISFSF